MLISDTIIPAAGSPPHCPHDQEPRGPVPLRQDHFPSSTLCFSTECLTGPRELYWDLPTAFAVSNRAVPFGVP